jgi:hypothetical protein
MTLEDVENSLPNGLHDAELYRLQVDYPRGTLQAELAVWIGDMGDPSEKRERYRRGRIEITGLVFLIMEPPDSRYPVQKSTKLTIDGCDQRQSLSAALLNALPENSFFRSLWVGEWNAFIHIAGTGAKFSWMDHEGLSELRAKG